MRLVISDIGGVVCDSSDVVPLMAAELDMTPDEFRMSMSAEIGLLMTGHIGADEFWERFARRVGRRVEDELWGKLYRPVVNPEVARLLAEVRNRVRVVAGTNTIEPHYRILEEAGWLSSFDAVYASHLMGLAKPDRRFYLRILDEEMSSPNEAVFFDDLEENVAAAREAGLAAVQFSDAAGLESSLRGFGLLNRES